MKKKTLTLATGAILLCAASAHAQTPDTQTQVDTLLAEHENSELGFSEAYHAFKPRFEKFVTRYKGTEPEARATLWLIQQTWWLREDGKMESTAWPLAQDLIKRHPNSPQLDLLAEYRYVFSKEQQAEMYRRLLEVSPLPNVQAAAHFGLAQTAPIRSSDGTANEHYQILLEQYADVPWRQTTFGAIADARLNPHAPDDLAVGKPAPEIIGIDHNGQPMKLSDHRGKVVLLDFWGDW